MSQAAATALPPAALICAATASTPATLMSPSTTDTPSSASRIAVALPMPVAAPTMTATLPFKPRIRSSLLCVRPAIIDDLDAAVLWFLHAIGGRDKQVALALGDDRDLG